VFDEFGGQRSRLRNGLRFQPRTFVERDRRLRRGAVFPAENLIAHAQQTARPIDRARDELPLAVAQFGHEEEECVLEVVGNDEVPEVVSVHARWHE
jgi:hypothetical protein